MLRSAVLVPRPLHPGQNRKHFSLRSFGCLLFARAEGEIKEVIARFVATCRLCEEAGFDGVQLHAAHGYLLSQFLRSASLSFACGDACPYLLQIRSAQSL
jgi:hypothetical protein